MASRVVLFFLMALAASATSAYPTDQGFYYGLGTGDGDQGLLADTYDQLVQEVMEADPARRELRQANHVSMGAMAANRVPCNRRGQSYYNCRDRQQANPYTRGCTRVTHCARSNR